MCTPRDRFMLILFGQSWGNLNHLQYKKLREKKEEVIFKFLFYLKKVFILSENLFLCW
jgi:hypothetical protein